MLSKNKGTGWIQKLSKEEIIDELKQRGIPHSESENYNDLRERLRSNIKSVEKPLKD